MPLHVNQSFLTVQKCQKMFHQDHYILCQITEAANIPTYIEIYECRPEEVKLFCPKDDSSTGEFLGLYKTIGLIIVRGDHNEAFFDYGYKKEKSKLLYSVQRKHIPNFLSGTLFDKFRDLIANGKLK